MSDQRKELAKYWMEKSKRSLIAAEYQFNQNDYDFCANRLYYAAFYAVCAVLVLRGFSYKKHSGVRAALHRYFVKTGIIPFEYGALYDALLRDREDADYVAFSDLDPEILRKEIFQVNDFINIFNEILGSEIENKQKEKGN